MSSYTMRLQEYIESFSQYQTGLSTAEKIEIGRTKLFDFDYPIFDENYKKDFETHFIRNFYMREIGFETEGLFKFQLESWLLINMPYWNKMYESELLTFDPLVNSKMDVNHNKTNNETRTDTRDSTSHTEGSSSGTADGTDVDDNFNRKLRSDTPDNRLAITTNDGQGVIEYANEIEEDAKNNSKTVHSTSSDSGTSDSTQNDTLSSTIDDTENYTQHREGKIGVQSYSKLLGEYRDTFLRIDRQIFKEMNELFMLVY